MPQISMEDLPDTFTYTQAIAAGLNHHRLYALRDAGELEQVGRGLYRKASAQLVDFELLEAARRARQATICLLSALAQHELTDAIPARHDLTLPRGEWHPRLGPAIKWHSFDPDTFSIGRTVLAIDAETEIGLYDAERSIIDAFRLRHDIGSDVAYEALRRWLRRGGRPGRIMTTARAFPKARPSLLGALQVLQ